MIRVVIRVMPVVVRRNSVESRIPLATRDIFTVITGSIATLGAFIVTALVARGENFPGVCVDRWNVGSVADRMTAAHCTIDSYL